MKIKFHGYLKKLCPKEFYEIEANTPAEAIRGLTNQMKQLIRVSGNRWRCRVRECPTKDSLYSNNSDLEELNLYPDYSPAGGGKGGVLQMIIGAIIVVIGLIVFAAGIYFENPAVAEFGVEMMKYGAILMLSGFITWLCPVPKSDSEEESNRKSKNLANKSNTTEIGTRIAVAYGMYKHYGQLISAQTGSVDE